MRALALALAVLAVAAAPALAARSLRAVGSLPPTSTLPTEDCLNAFVAILEAGKCNPKKSPLATCCAAYASLGANCLQSMLDFMASDPKLKDISEATQANLKLCGGDNPNPDPLPDDACVEAFMATVAEDGGCGAATATAATCCAALGGLPEGCLDSIVAYLETQPEAATVVDTM